MLWCPLRSIWSLKDLITGLHSDYVLTQSHIDTDYSRVSIDWTTAVTEVYVAILTH